ncbi:hypothetical protein DYB35_008866 [Aphanomyces astaci]|nr:hypothetical protein DYB35_008866 [Aphanomyces astaci]
MAEPSTPLSPSEMTRLREKRERHKKNKADPLVPLDGLLDRLLQKHIDPIIVSQTAQWMAAHDALSVQVQIKLRAFALSDRTKSFNHKVMLFYVLHEFLKIGAPVVDGPSRKQSTAASFDAVRRTRHMEWMATVEHILHACVREYASVRDSYKPRDMKPIEDHRKKLLKTLGRWDELGIYRGKLKEWKKVVLGEVKVRKAPPRILQNVVAPFDKEGLDLRRELDRGNIAWFFEPVEFRSPRAKLRHWRFTGAAFIDTLGRCLGLEAHVVVAAMSFYQTLFKRGFYAKERGIEYKDMDEILTPLVTGDEEKEELERLHLLHYELQVLQGIEFDLTIALPFDAFAAAAAAFPPAVKDAAFVALKELYGF